MGKFQKTIDFIIALLSELFWSTGKKENLQITFISSKILIPEAKSETKRV